MSLFGGGEAQINKEIDKVLQFTSKMMAAMFVTEKWADDLKFERPDSEFRFQIFCLSAVVMSVAHKLGDVNFVAVNACHSVTDFCLEDPIRFFGGKVDPEAADQQGIDLQRHFLERLTSIGMFFGNPEKVQEVFNGLCELAHEVESPQPINPADYKRLSEFAGRLLGVMTASANIF